VLANPDGPLAVIGHVDLAWSYSFQEAEGAGTRADRFQEMLRTLADGNRVGMAAFDLISKFADADSHLATLYNADEGPDDSARIKRKASLWMLRNDLRGYVLLGDPAARLAIAPGATQVRPPARPPAEVRGAPARDVKQMEKAVLDVIRGTGPCGTVAKRYGYDKDALQKWVDAYQEAGRAVLEQMS
jgi:hypothetical protein